MSTQKSRKDFVSHSVLNDRYPHGRVEKITADGIWLEGGTRWWHFDKARLKNQVLPKIGAYVVMTESSPGIIGHIATQHELQQPSDAATSGDVEDYRPPVGDPRISATDDAYFEAERKRGAKQQNTAPAVPEHWSETEALAAIVAMEAGIEQPNTASDRVIPIMNMEDYRVRADGLALAVQLLNLEAHYGIDRDDVFRVAQEVIRWIQARGED